MVKNEDEVMKVLDRAAGLEYNMYNVHMYITSTDTVYISREAILTHTVVHSGLTFAQQAMKDDSMYSYVGMSKRSCRRCQIWLQAFNHKHDTKFCTAIDRFLPDSEPLSSGCSNRIPCTHHVLFYTGSGVYCIMCIIYMHHQRSVFP